MTKPPLRIVSWNVNSIRARFEHLSVLVEKYNPDVILLQELKCDEKDINLLEINSMGYNFAINGQKSYNGVAILSKYKIEDSTFTLPEMEDTLTNFAEEHASQKRYIEGLINVSGSVVRLSSIYIPNGGSSEELPYTQTKKFAYKRHFYKQLCTHSCKTLKYEEIWVLGGDFNVAHNEIDLYNPKDASDSCGFHIEERRALEELLGEGLLDAFRVQHPNKQIFSWWDYRASSYKFNKGMRIDYIMLSPLAADLPYNCTILHEFREMDRPSDHAPVLIDLTI